MRRNVLLQFGLLVVVFFRRGSRRNEAEIFFLFEKLFHVWVTGLFRPSGRCLVSLLISLHVRWFVRSHTFLHLAKRDRDGTEHEKDHQSELK